MATVVRMRSSKTTETAGKVPSYASESDLFHQESHCPNGKNGGRSSEASPALTGSPGSSNPASDHGSSRNIHLKETASERLGSSDNVGAGGPRSGSTSGGDQTAANLDALESSSWHQFEHEGGGDMQSSPPRKMLGFGVRQHSFSVPSSPQTTLPHFSESSSNSLQEMFEVDDLLSPSLLGVLPSESSAADGRPSTDDDDVGFLLNDDSLQERKLRQDRLATTPPLTVYSAYPNNHSNMASAGGGSRVNHSNTNSNSHQNKWGERDGSALDSGRSTPTNSVIASSVVSDASGAGSAPQSMKMRPLLYSAIGSLENPHSSTLGSFNKRAHASGGRDFCKMGGNLVSSQNAGMLIPPQPTQGGFFSNKINKRTSAPSTLFQTKAKVAQEPPTTATATTNRGTGSGSTKGTNKSEIKNGSGSQQQHPIPGTTKNDNATSSSKETEPGKVSNLKSRRSSKKDGSAGPQDGTSRRVSYDKDVLRKKKQQKPVEMFRPSCDAYTPRMERKKIAYKPAEMRTPVQKMSTPMGTLQRPNFRDALRRVAMIIHQHIVKIEQRFDAGNQQGDEGLFKNSMKDIFNETNYVIPTYKCTMVRIPMARPGMVYGLRKIKANLAVPTEGEIYEFAHQLFKKVQLSSECSIVCLIYVEKLMEAAKVPLLACTWRPIFMCGLLLASKVWQDLSSWNIEFASVYPQFPLDAINRLELNFLQNIKWDLYISSSLYAKYYFALRSLVEKRDFRQRYNRMVGGVDSVAQSEALKIQKRTEQVKEEAILHLSRSM